jgi:type II secretory pathway component PulC
MLRAADWSYAMADAHPDVAAVARHRASNAEAGVVVCSNDCSRSAVIPAQGESSRTRRSV